MRANKLMVGDYLFSLINKNGNIEKKVVKVNGIRTDCDYPVIQTDESDVWYGIETYEPIPLTPEILEKNGFTHSFGDSDFYDYEKWEKKVDDKTIRVIKDHDGWFCRVDDNKLTRSMGIAPYVHTMQNIIRIGGIDKEIEL